MTRDKKHCTGHLSPLTEKIPPPPPPPEASISSCCCVERSNLAPACSRASEILDLDVVFIVDFQWLSTAGTCIIHCDSHSNQITKPS